MIESRLTCTTLMQQLSGESWIDIEEGVKNKMVGSIFS